MPMTEDEYQELLGSTVLTGDMRDTQDWYDAHGTATHSLRIASELVTCPNGHGFQGIAIEHHHHAPYHSFNESISTQLRCGCWLV